MYGDFPAKNTIYTPYIPINVWFRPTLHIRQIAFQIILKQLKHSLYGLNNIYVRSHSRSYSNNSSTAQRLAYGGSKSVLRVMVKQLKVPTPKKGAGVQKNGT